MSRAAASVARRSVLTVLTHWCGKETGVKRRKEKKKKQKQKTKKTERERGDAVRSNNTHPRCVKATYTDQNHTYTLPCGDENEKAASENTHDNTWTSTKSQENWHDWVIQHFSVHGDGANRCLCFCFDILPISVYMEVTSPVFPCYV